MDKIRKAAAAGIVGEILYFVSVSLFLALKTEWALTLWEIMTVAGAFMMLGVLAVFADEGGMKGIYRTFMHMALCGTVILTSTAHFTSIGVTRPLAASGENIPCYCMIGQFPSYEMTVDYTAWGLFMGFALLCFSLGMAEKMIKTVSAVCAVLCFAGFIGSFFSDSLWYAAPMGYGIGFLILCMIVSRRKVTAK